VDPCVDQLLAAVTAQAVARRHCRVGVRLSGRVTGPMVSRLHALGFRRFAVESHEARPAALILGQAALAAAE
jgi:DNA-binding MurR/RpiR family transcriptional regulator